MKTILIPVVDKIAQSPDEEIVCGNSDYYIEFAFDSEWDGYDVKTARFVYSGKKTDVVFEGNTVQVPVMSNTTKVFVGVFSGDLRTSTPAAIKCYPSILCKGGMPDDPTPDVYAQIMEMFNGGIKEFPLPVSEGGTGATNADEARKNLGIEESGGASGSGLPEVTEADNGKILMVVGGQWENVDFPAGEQTDFWVVTARAADWSETTDEENNPIYQNMVNDIEKSMENCKVAVALHAESTATQIAEARRCGVYAKDTDMSSIRFVTSYDTVPTCDLKFKVEIKRPNTLSYSVDDETMTLTIVEGYNDGSAE